MSRIEQTQGLSKFPKHAVEVISTLRVAESSRGDISRSTGISSASTSNLVASLADRGLIVPTGKRTARRHGPDSELFRTNPDFGYFLGIGINEQSISSVLIDFSFQRRDLNVAAVPTGESLAPFFRNMRSLIANCLEQIPPDKLLGIGFSLPSFVDKTGGVHASPTIPFLQYLDMQEVMGSTSISTQLTDVAITADSDANSLALAEQQIGGHEKREGHQDMFCVMTRGDLRIGLIVNGKVYKGSNNYAGWVSSPQIPLNIGNILEEDIDVAGEKLGFELGQLATIMNPGLIVLHGINTQIYDEIFPSLRQAFISSCYSSIETHTQFSLSRLGEEGPAVGAAINSYLQLISA